MSHWERDRDDLANLPLPPPRVLLSWSCIWTTIATLCCRLKIQTETTMPSKIDKPSHAPKPANGLKLNGCCHDAGLVTANVLLRVAMNRSSLRFALLWLRVSLGCDCVVLTVESENRFHKLRRRPLLVDGRTKSRTSSTSGCWQANKLIVMAPWSGMVIRRNSSSEP